MQKDLIETAIVTNKAGISKASNLQLYGFSHDLWSWDLWSIDSMIASIQPSGIELLNLNCICREVQISKLDLEKKRLNCWNKHNKKPDSAAGLDFHLNEETKWTPDIYFLAIAIF